MSFIKSKHSGWTWDLKRTPFTGGGGSSSAPAPTQTSVQNTNIPEYAQPYVETMLGAAQQQIFNYAPDESGNMVATGIKPYTPYSNNPQDYVAGFSPLQQQAQSNIANMQTPGQYGMATQAAGMGTMGSFGLAGQEAQTGSNLAQASTNPNVVGAYMNPYIQNALAPAQQLLNQQYGMQGAQEQGAATSAGAFGGSREALMSGLNQQNRMLAQNQLVGNAYQNAFNQAQNQMNTVSAQGLAGQQAAMQGMGQGISGANALAGIGGQQAQTGLSINQAQEAAGAAQQAQQQNIINQQIQNYATAQQYPMLQLANMSSLLRGLPMQSATTQTYQAAPSSVSQLAGLGTTALAGAKLASMKEGGIAKVKKFDIGGSVKHDLMQMAEADPKAFMEHMKTATSPEEKKIGYQVAAETGLIAAAPNVRMAGGGIVAFAGGGDADVDEYDDSYAEDAEDAQEEAENDYNDKLMQQLYSMQAAGMAMPQEHTSSVGIKHEAKGAPQPLGYKNTDEFKKKIEHLESRGRDYDEKGNILTSHKGAVGRMQTMPNTLRDPGFGVKPAQSSHPDELARVGRDYADAMLARYKDPKLAAMAYNWGPGNVDKWLASGKQGPVPGETRQYASNFAKGGILAFNKGGDKGEEQEDDDEGTDYSAAALAAPGIYQVGKGIVQAAPRLPAGSLSGAPTAAARTLGSTGTSYLGAAGETALPAAAVGYGGYKLSKAATKTLARPEMAENRAALQDNSFLGGMSGDTALASSILDAPNSKTNEALRKAPTIDSTEAERERNRFASFQAQNKPFTNDVNRVVAEQNAKDRAAAGADNKDSAGKDAGGGDLTEANSFQKRLMDFMDKKEAGLTSQKQEDKWMAILAAGLGMMGGTSPWAGVNIGKGGQEGVASMLSSNKQRGAEEAALGKLYTSGYRAQQADKARADMGQINAYNTYQKNVGDTQGKREALFSKEMSSGSNAMLNARIEALGQKLIKDPEDKKAKAEYDSLQKQKEAIRSRIYSSIKEPSPPPGLNLGTGSASSVIKLD